ncbi:DNA methyltransferase [Ekhidna sp. MALMAid0563]|uniref:DNA methyltransferase n=1 Tax=Ekhidna sp. MALMAid0563 TaxID=3143937 RepID=UPI0032DFBA9B
MNELKKLYNTPLPAKRTGALYNAFPYPTKISPEAIAIYIACHTQVGDSVLDPFAGSGTTGLATILCDNPTEEMINTAKEMGVNPKWGKRNAVLYELSTLGSFISQVMCNPPSSSGFEKAAKNLLKEVSNELSEIYTVKDDNGQDGEIRHIIWSDVILCPNCKLEHTYFDIAVEKSPLQVKSDFECPNCQNTNQISSLEKSTEKYYDPLLNNHIVRKKRVPAWIYGKTGKRNWSRKASPDDLLNEDLFLNLLKQTIIPIYNIQWGILFRKGYHKGITHLHHFYTNRNLIVFGRLWSKVNSYPKQYHDALKLLLLSYNSSHSTLMSRVVVKKNSSDFVITGSQSGVLYISSLPVEKNIFEGIKRKITTLSKAFKLTEASNSKVDVINGSSTNIKGLDTSIDYVFTDPPFGDYIPYSEINQLNEAWLERLTENKNEVIINKAQHKTVDDYGALMGQVFHELNKVLKKDGKISLVFHSAKSEVWRGLVNSFSKAGFTVRLSNILDKVQGSFKQVTSNIKVQGDPLLLLTKERHLDNSQTHKTGEEEHYIIQRIIDDAFHLNSDLNEQKPERLYSRYISACIESGVPVSQNAKDFYLMLRKELQNTHPAI